MDSQYTLQGKYIYFLALSYSVTWHLIDPSNSAINEWYEGWKRRGWRTAQGGEVRNKDLIKRLKRALNVRPGSTRLHYVRGHVGVEGNEEADRLANMGAMMPAVPAEDYDLGESSDEDGSENKRTIKTDKIQVNEDGFLDPKHLYTDEQLAEMSRHQCFDLEHIDNGKPLEEPCSSHSDTDNLREQQGRTRRTGSQKQPALKKQCRQ